MKIQKYEAQVWYLLGENDDYYLDVVCNLSFFTYDVTIQLTSSEVSRYHQDGRQYLNQLARDIQFSAPATATSTSKYNGRQVTRECKDRVSLAIAQWQQQSTDRPSEST